VDPRALRGECPRHGQADPARRRRDRDPLHRQPTRLVITIRQGW
jgi:hypothetical protein